MIVLTRNELICQMELNLLYSVLSELFCAGMWQMVHRKPLHG